MNKTALIMGVLACVAGAQAQLSPEMKKLEWLKGKFSGKLKSTFPGMDPVDMGTKMDTVVEGMYLKNTGNYMFGTMPMSETTYMGYDPIKKKYFSYAFASWAKTPRIEWGELKDDRIIFTSEPWQDDAAMPPVKTRTTIIKKSDSKQQVTIEMDTDGKWGVVADGVLTRDPIKIGK